MKTGSRLQCRDLHPERAFPLVSVTVPFNPARSTCACVVGTIQAVIAKDNAETKSELKSGWGNRGICILESTRVQRVDSRSDESIERLEDVYRIIWRFYCSGVNVRFVRRPRGPDVSLITFMEAQLDSAWQKERSRTFSPIHRPLVLRATPSSSFFDRLFTSR